MAINHATWFLTWHVAINMQHYFCFSFFPFLRFTFWLSYKGKLCFGRPISQYYCFENRSLRNLRDVHYFKKKFPFHALYTVCNCISENTPPCIPINSKPPLHVTGPCAFNKHKNLKRKSYQICKTQSTR